MPRRKLGLKQFHQMAARIMRRCRRCDTVGSVLKSERLVPAGPAGDHMSYGLLSIVCGVVGSGRV